MQGSGVGGAGQKGWKVHGGGEGGRRVRSAGAVGGSRHEGRAVQTTTGAVASGGAAGVFGPATPALASEGHRRAGEPPASSHGSSTDGPASRASGRRQRPRTPLIMAISAPPLHASVRKPPPGAVPASHRRATAGSRPPAARCRRQQRAPSRPPQQARSVHCSRLPSHSGFRLPSPRGAPPSRFTTPTPGDHIHPPPVPGPPSPRKRRSAERPYLPIPAPPPCTVSQAQIRVAQRRGGQPSGGGGGGRSTPSRLWRP